MLGNFLVPGDSPRPSHRFAPALHSRTKGSEIDTIDTLIPDFFGELENEPYRGFARMNADLVWY
jgi:hypothetical protein